MGNVLFFNKDERIFSVETNEKFNRITLNNIKSILEYQTFKTNSFMIGTYKYISDEENMIILGAENGDIVYDDYIKVDTNSNINEIKEESYQKIKNLTIIK